MTTSTARIVFCAATILAACSGPSQPPTTPSSPTVPSSPPPHAELRVQTGIPGFDPYAHGYASAFAGWEAIFDASGSSGDGLSFRIDFGDGTIAKTAVTPHVVLLDPHDGSYRRAIRLTVTDRFGRVDSQTVSLQLWDILTNESGMFVSRDVENPATNRRLLFQHQNGTQLTGKYEESSAPLGWTTSLTTPLTATLSGANHIHVRLDDGSIDMDGSYTFQGPIPYTKFPDWLILSVHGGSADGTVVPFVYYDPY